MGELIYTRLLERLSGGLSILPDKPDETAENTLKALWLTASGHPVSVATAETADLPELSEDHLALLEELLSRRLAGIPLAHLTGRQSFMGLEMLAGPEALIPRKETELLARTAIGILESGGQAHPVVIDVCTGGGNIALAMSLTVPGARVYAADLSAGAIELAQANADFLAVGSSVSFHVGDLFEPVENLGLAGKVHLITCNPPYISSARVPEMPEEISGFEPSLAFDGGAFGINLIRKLVAEAPAFLTRGGFLAFEVGEGQGEMIKKLVDKSASFENVRTVNDEQAVARVIVAQKV